MNDELESYRSEVDAIDDQIMALLAKRQAAVLKISHYKAEKGLSALQPERHQAVTQARQDRAVEYGLNPAMVVTIWRAIMNEAVRIQQEMIDGK